MKLLYYPETDSLYIEFNDRPSTATRELVAGIVVDHSTIRQHPRTQHLEQLALRAGAMGARGHEDGDIGRTDDAIELVEDRLQHRLAWLWASDVADRDGHRLPSFRDATERRPGNRHTQCRKQRLARRRARWLMPRLHYRGELLGQVYLETRGAVVDTNPHRDELPDLAERSPTGS